MTRGTRIRNAGLLRGAAWSLILLAAAGTVRADPAEVAGQKLGRVLRGEEWSKVLVTVHEDARSRGSTDSATNSESLSQQLLITCQAAGKKAATPAAECEALDKLTVVAAPRPAELRDLLKKEDAGLVLTAIWQAKKIGKEVRLSLVSDRKVVWSWRGLMADGTVPEQVASPRASQSKVTSPSDRKTKETTAGNTGTAWLTAASEASDPMPFAAGGTRTVNDANNGLITAAPATLAVGAPDTSTLNGKVLRFGKTHLGQQVGNGHCWSLGAEALKDAGAKSPVGVIFGSEVPLDETQPGDILQFRGAQIVKQDGSLWTFGTPFHTAIVGAVRGTEMLIFHQNVNGVMKVQKNAIDVANLKSGSVTVYRVEPKEP